MDESLRERREAVIREHLASENEHRFDATIATFAHPRYELIGNGLVYDGEQAVRKYFQTSRAQVPDQRNELISLRHADDAVVVEFWLLGTLAETEQPSLLTGRKFRCRMCAVFEFENDLIVCERVYWDRQTITDQLRGA